MKLHKSNHGLLFSIIVLILCYIIFSGCISSPTKMTSPSVQTTSNKFTTYTDQIKGFSIDYPSDWSKQTISSSQNQYIIMFLPPDQGCSITVSVLPSQSSGKDVKEWANGMITNGPQKWPGFSLINTKDTNLAEIPAVMFEFIGKGKQNVLTHSKVILAVKGDSGYIIDDR